MQLTQPVPGRPCLGDDALRRIAVLTRLAVHPVRIAELAVGQHARVGAANLGEQIAGRRDQVNALGELAQPPHHQHTEVERDRRALFDVRRVAQHLLDALHGEHASRRTAIGTVVDHPFRLHRHLVEHGQPAHIALGHKLQQSLEQRQRLAVVFELLGLAQRLAEHVDRLTVTGIGRADEVWRGHAERPGGDQHPGDPPVHRAPARGTDALINRLLDERVRHLVPEVPAMIVLGQQAGVDQTVQGTGQLRVGRTSERGQVADAHAVPENGDQLERRAVTPFEPGQPGADALTQILGQLTQHGPAQVGMLLEQCAQQAQREQRNATGTVHQPVDEGARHLVPDYSLREFPHPVRAERAQGVPGKHPLLLERVDDTGRDGIVGQLGRPCCEHQQDARLGEGAREKVQRLPGRTVSQVDVIKDDNDGQPEAQGGQQVRKCGEHANTGCAGGAAVPDRRANRRKNHRKIMGRLASQRDDVPGIQRAQMPFQRLDPQAEGRSRAQRVRARGEPDDIVAASRNLSSKPRLPHIGIADQQNGTQVTLFDHAEGSVEEADI